MKIKVNAMGDACPLPIVKAKNAIKELTGAGEVEVLVDNEIATQNLEKMAAQKQYGFACEKLEEGKYQVVLSVAVGEDAGKEDIPAEEFCDCTPKSPAKQNKLIVIASECMGDGSEELGKLLSKAFIYALTQQDILPKTILFYNSGVKLVCEDSPAIADLKELESRGVEILACGTCLNFFGLTEQIQVGTVTNMYAIVEKMMESDNMIRY